MTGIEALSISIRQTRVFHIDIDKNSGTLRISLFVACFTLFHLFLKFRCYNKSSWSMFDIFYDSMC